MHTTHRIASTSLALTSLTLAALAGPADRARTVLNGHYDNDHSLSGGGSGYETAAGQCYTVVASATFDGNVADGLFASGSPVTVRGGEFTGNGKSGLITVKTPITVFGGTFTGNRDSGLMDVGATVTIEGGKFTGNRYFGLVAGGPGASVTLVGTGLRFAGAPAGTTTLGTGGNTFRPGAVSGTLQNNATPSRISFLIDDGARITLVNAPRRQGH